MKQLFIVHSNITWLITQKLIETERLNPADCIILTDRRMPVDTCNFKVTDISDLTLHDLKWRELAQVLYFRQQNQGHLQAIDRIIANLCPNGESYQLYLPHHRDLRYWALTSHRQCARFFYVEEGSMSYWGVCPNPVIPQYQGLTWQVKRFFLTLAHDWYLQGRVPALLRSFYPDHQKYGGAYGLSDMVFPGMHHLKVLPLPFQPMPEWAQVQRVVAFGPYVEFGQMSKAVRMQVTQELLDYFIRQNISKVYFKYHPSQLTHPENLNALKELIGTYQDRIQLIEIPSSVSLENIAYTAKADFYLITSSVAIYALLCGSRVISYGKQVLKYEPEFQKTLDTLPQNVQEKLEFIEF